MTFPLLEFGYEQMSTLVAHYSTTLEKAGVNGEAALRELSTLKGILYGRYVDDNQVCLIICTEKVFYIILLLYKLQIWDKDP